MRLGDRDLFLTIGVEFRERVREVVSIGIANGNVESEGGSRVVAVIGEEWRNWRSRMRSVVVGEFCNREKVSPIILLIGAIQAKIAFERLIRSLGLTIGFGVVGCRKLELHVEALSERSGEVRSEERTAIGNDVGRDAMLRKDMEKI